MGLSSIIGLLLFSMYRALGAARVRYIERPLRLEDVPQADRPAWLWSSDVDHAGWLNCLLSSMWPKLRDFMEPTLEASITAALRSFRSPLMSDLRCERLSLGVRAPEIESIQSVSHGEHGMHMDLVLFWHALADPASVSRGAASRRNVSYTAGRDDACLVVVVQQHFMRVPAVLTDIRLRACLRVHLGPTCATPPFVAATALSFVDTPDVQLRSLQAMHVSLPQPELLRSVTQSAIRSALGFMTEPRRLVVPLVDDSVWAEGLRATTPLLAPPGVGWAGILTIAVHRVTVDSDAAGLPLQWLQQPPKNVTLRLSAGLHRTAGRCGFASDKVIHEPVVLHVPWSSHLDCDAHPVLTVEGTCKTWWGTTSTVLRVQRALAAWVSELHIPDLTHHRYVRSFIFGEHMCSLFSFGRCIVSLGFVPNSSLFIVPSPEQWRRILPFVAPSAQPWSGEMDVELRFHPFEPNPVASWTMAPQMAGSHAQEHTADGHGGRQAPVREEVAPNETAARRRNSAAAPRDPPRMRDPSDLLAPPEAWLVAYVHGATGLTKMDTLRSGQEQRTPTISNTLSPAWKCTMDWTISRIGEQRLVCMVMDEDLGKADDVWARLDIPLKDIWLAPEGFLKGGFRLEDGRGHIVGQLDMTLQVRVVRPGPGLASDERRKA